MLLISCPVCAFRGDETGFSYGGEAHIRRPATHQTEISAEEQETYLYRRRNPRGLAHERWLCRSCGKWFHAVRDSDTLAFKATYPIDESPPAAFPLIPLDADRSSDAAGESDGPKDGGTS